MHQPNQANLLGLPVELRLQIYYHVWPPLTKLPRNALVRNHDIYISQSNFKACAALLQVNHLLRHEAQASFYTNNSFFAVINKNRCDGVLRFLLAVGPDNLSMIKDIIFRFRVPDSIAQEYEDKQRNIENIADQLWASETMGGAPKALHECWFKAERCAIAKLLIASQAAARQDLRDLEERYKSENWRAVVDFAQALPAELDRYSIRGNLSEHADNSRAFKWGGKLRDMKVRISREVVCGFEQELTRKGFDFFRNCEIYKDGQRVSRPDDLQRWQKHRPWSMGNSRFIREWRYRTRILRDHEYAGVCECAPEEDAGDEARLPDGL